MNVNDERLQCGSARGSRSISPTGLDRIGFCEAVEPMNDRAECHCGPYIRITSVPYGCQVDHNPAGFCETVWLITPHLSQYLAAF